MATLFIIATPIGNLEDITIRALTVLSSVDVLACEDTLHTQKIFSRYLKPCPQKIISYHMYNEENAGKRIINHLKDNLSVGLCSKAGYPGISDPGYRIISQAIEYGFPIDVIPGASAVPMSLLMSGLPSSSYTFKGFPPKKSGKRQTFFRIDVAMPHTLIFYESPQRLNSFLHDAEAIFGNRKACVCCELTKTFQKVFRGSLQHLIEQLTPLTLKGEISIVIAGNNKKFILPEAFEEDLE